MIKRLFLIFLLPLFTLHGCKPELLGEYYLGDLVYTNPYGGYEDLLYLSTQGDSIVFLGNGRHRSKHKAYVSINSNDYYYWEDDYTNFKEVNGEFGLRIKLATSQTNPPKLSISLSEFHSEQSKNFFSLSYFTLPLNEQNLRPEQWHYDSLYVLNCYYYNVFADSTDLFEYTQKSISNLIHPSIFYYNTTHGLIKVDFDDGTSWELKEIIP